MICQSLSTSAGVVNAVVTEDGRLVQGHVYEFEVGSAAPDQRLVFQQGPIKDVGRNGIQNEQVLAVLIHRLEYLQGLVPCRENALALTKLEEALMWLERRHRDRTTRGVEGTSSP